MSENYQIYGAQNLGNIAGNIIIGSNKVSYTQELTEAAAEIKQLLKDLDSLYPINTTSEKMNLAVEVIRRIEADPSLHRRIFSLIKSGGTEALKQELNHPAASILINALEDWQKSEVTDS
ncbi:MAG: hypothetical protein WBV73_23055 [Phormidium sp.]